MISSNNRWLIHTLLVGLIPILTRLLAWASTTGDTIAPVAVADFITLGLVVHVSILNEMEHLSIPEPAAKSLLNAFSILFITCYGTLYALVALNDRNAELINVKVVLYASIALCFLSATVGFILFQYSKRSLQ